MVNRTAHPGALTAGDAARAIHAHGPIVDLVAGSALFRSVFVERARSGHVDLPRLKAAGVNILGLTIATRFPDLRGTLSYWHFRSLGAPRSALRTNMALADWLIGRIDGWAAQSGAELAIVRTAMDLERSLAVGGPTGVVLLVQGGHVFDGDLANVARVQQLGIRVLAPAHVMDNEVVGSGTGRRAGGLTGFGRELLAELEAQGVIVDLAHMSPAGVQASLPLLDRPFLISHTGLTEAAGGRSRWRRYSPATRNAPASLAAEIGRRRGLVGIILGTQLLGGSDLRHAVRTIRIAVEAAGGEHVAIGSDMDGALRTVIDVEGLPALTDELLESGLEEAVVRGVMGGNAVEFLRRALPL